MFTGIIEGYGKLIGKRTAGGGLVFELEAGFEITDPKEGESIAVNGVCLTAYGISGRRFSADVSPESLTRTRLGDIHVGNRVNLERALRLSDRLGGHIVSGHVDCIATLKSSKAAGQYTLLSFSLPKEQSRYIVEKGSVTIDGISLTVNSCKPGEFSVSIIPHTLKMTTLNALKMGDMVNIEVDIIGKYVEKLLGTQMFDAVGQANAGTRIDAGFLAEHGFFK